MHPVASGVAKLSLLRLPAIVLAGLGAVGFAVGIFLGNSGPPRSAPLLAATPPPPVAREASAWDPPQGLVELPRHDDRDPKRVLVPGCTIPEYEARKRELQDLSTAANRDSDRAEDVATVLAQLRLTLDRPCLRHAARMTPLPSDPSRVTLFALSELIPYLEGTMTLELDGQGVLAFIPPDLALELDAEARARLAPFACDDKSCGHTRGYQARAEQQLAASAYAETLALLEPRPASASRRQEPALDASLCPAPSGSFDAWSACVAARVPRRVSQSTALPWSMRPGYRALTRGWLILYHEGPRPSNTSGLTAFDLRTGSFYAASSTSPCHSAPFQTSETGRVSVEALRELAFALVTRPALQARRVYGSRARIPASVVLSSAALDDTSSPREESDRGSYGSYTFRYVDGPLYVEGAFASFASGVDDHLEELTEVIGTGAVRGCATAPMPARETLHFQDLRRWDERTDAASLPLEWWQEMLEEDGLEPQLNGLRHQPCLGRKRIEAAPRPQR